MEVEEEDLVIVPFEDPTAFGQSQDARPKKKRKTDLPLYQLQGNNRPPQRRASEADGRQLLRDSRMPPLNEVSDGMPTLDVLQAEVAITALQRKRTRRNFRKVVFGAWQIEPWYYSPYPLEDVDDAVYAAFARVSPPPSGTNTRNGKNSSFEMAEDDDFDQGAGPLWVCDRCFKYMKNGVSHEVHAKTCHMTHPPGRKVYQRGAHTIWEVDGALAKLYCQNLSLFGKLFIDVKTIFFDCEPFMFYLLTDADPRRDHVLGYFSKEKLSYDDYNLACITTFPPYQKRGYGMLMIEFSYELSRRAHVLGTPERPLSEMGLKTYLAFWISALVRYFRTAFTDPNDPDGSGRKGARSKWRKKTKGWDGEVPTRRNLSGIEDPFAEKRVLRGRHITVRLMLDDISNATSIRPEDVSLALSECGLLKRKRNGDGEEGGMEIVMTRDEVEAVAQTWGIKRPFLDLAHVRL